MSTLKSNNENMTINADGASSEVKFQANGVEKASISAAGAFTSTTIDATKLTGTIPNFTSTGIDDNATSTAITIDSSENVTPGADGTQDLGSSTKRWANIYTGDMHLSNEGAEGNEADGTIGNWTIQEGDENLYIRNNKTKKMYKFNLEEIG